MAHNTVVETVNSDEATAKVVVYNDDAIDTICVSILEISDRLPDFECDWAFADFTPEQARIVGQTLLNFADSKC